MASALKANSLCSNPDSTTYPLSTQNCKALDIDFCDAITCRINKMVTLRIPASKVTVRINVSIYIKFSAHSIHYTNASLQEQLCILMKFNTESLLHHCLSHISMQVATRFSQHFSGSLTSLLPLHLVTRPFGRNFTLVPELLLQSPDPSLDTLIIESTTPCTLTPVLLSYNHAFPCLKIVDVSQPPTG